MSWKLGNIASFVVLANLMASAPMCHAQLAVLDTTFGDEEGYQSGDLQFQSIIAGSEGTWLGHSGANVTTADGGSVVRSGDPRGNLFNRGATGGIAGGDGHGEIIGAGFQVGDRLTLRHSYSFEVPSSPHTGLLKTGVRPDYVYGGFESLPTIGLSLQYVTAGSGALWVFGNPIRDARDNNHHQFAMIVSAADVSVDSSSTSPVAFASDDLMLTWIADYVGADTWNTQEIVIDSPANQFTARASVVNPAALELVTVPGSSTDAFFGMQQLQGYAGKGVTHSIELLYEPITDMIPGDFDADADVDGMDFLSWQRNTLPISDLVFWHSNYGRTNLSETSAVFLVPEPNCAALIGFGIAAFLLVKASIHDHCV